MNDSIQRPPYDSELVAGLAGRPAEIPVTAENLERIRQTEVVPPIETVIEGRPLRLTDLTLTAHDGAELTLSVLERTGSTARNRPAIFWTHGGGMVAGHRWVDSRLLTAWVEEFDVVAGTIEYRLAPEHPDPVPVEDCYTGLTGFAARAAEFGFDPERLIIGGGSAGGGLAAGVSLIARDRGGPALAGQLLICPMLDDRDRTVSTLQFSGTGLWDREANRFGWGALLGSRAGGDDVSPYAAPARAENVSGLPPAFIDAGSAEVFRDEDTAYASAIWAAGGEAELHIWAGGFHGFEAVAAARVSQAAASARENWLRRVWRLEGAR